MTAGILPKIVPVMLIAILGTAAGPAAVLAGPAKSSLSPQGRGSLFRLITGAPITRSPQPAPGPLRRIPAGTVLPKNPATRIISSGNRCDLLAPRSLRGRLAANLPHAASPAKTVPPPATTPANRPASNNLPNRIVSQARSLLGTPYSLGGSLETGRATDCSGFVQFIYHKADIDLPRSAGEQAQEGAVVSRTLDFARLRPGDLLFFGKGSGRISHVGIYSGDGKMIHASGSNRGVIISDLRQPYLEGSFVVAKRLKEVQAPN